MAASRRSTRASPISSLPSRIIAGQVYVSKPGCVYHRSQCPISVKSAQQFRPCPLCPAGLTDRRNTFGELLSWGLIEQGLSRPFIKLPCYCAQLGLAIPGEIRARGRSWGSNLLVFSFEPRTPAEICRQAFLRW